MYKVLTILIFMYAAGHLIYPVFDNSGLTSTEPLMWFLSGGLAVLFSGFINLNYLIVGGNFTRLISIVTNATILFFILVLCVVIPEIQVFILAIIYLLTLIATATISLIGPNSEATYGTKE
jgi:hypothetical protein